MDISCASDNKKMTLYVREWTQYDNFSQSGLKIDQTSTRVRWDVSLKPQKLSTSCFPIKNWLQFHWWCSEARWTLSCCPVKSWQFTNFYSSYPQMHQFSCNHNTSTFIPNVLTLESVYFMHFGKAIELTGSKCLNSGEESISFQRCIWSDCECLYFYLCVSLCVCLPFLIFFYVLNYLLFDFFLQDAFVNVNRGLNGVFFAVDKLSCSEEFLMQF